MKIVGSDLAVKILEDYGLQERVPAVGLAKREEEIFVPGKARSILLPRKSEGLYLVQRVRDEAHRFAISFQKKSRKKHLTSSALDKIEGIGDKTKMKLLKHFGSVEMIRSASTKEIAALTGPKLADTIHKHLNP